MAIIVKGEITITKGFDTWKSMVKQNKHRMDEMGMVMLFAGNFLIWKHFKRLVLMKN